MNDYIYYDLQVRIFESNQKQLLRFSETRNSPLVLSSGDYLLSIVRFQIDTLSLPLFFCDIQKNQSNVNLTPYSIVLNYQDKYGTDETTTPTYVVWEPQHADSRVPKAPSETGTGYQDFSSEYYYAYTYQHFISLINKAFKTAHDKLVALAPDMKYVEPPFIAWDESSNRASLYVRMSHYDSTITPLEGIVVKIYFNQALMTLFSSFPYLRYDDNASTQKYQLVCDPYNELKVVSLAQNTNSFIKVSQETSSVALWSPVSSVIFTSNTMQVVPNQLSSPIVLDNGSAVYFGANNSAVFQNIITDLSVEQNMFKDGSNLLYTPATYRYIDLTGNNDIRNIEISVFWKDKLNFLHDLILEAGCSASLKVMFQKKKSII